MDVQFFSKGKVEGKNEDFFDYNQDCFALADGATDKSGRKYDNKTGGEIVARLVVKEALLTLLTGNDLVSYLNTKVSDLYNSLGISDLMLEAVNRFTCSCIVARIINDKIIITSVGDSCFRINGGEIHKASKLSDEPAALERAKYIAETGDVTGSREHIMPMLLGQFGGQNNPNHSFGYGVIDGSNTPEIFIETLFYPKCEIKTLELFSDGYFSVPTGNTITDWEIEYEKVEKEDPDKWKKYKSTKSKDDRTIAIIKF